MCNLHIMILDLYPQHSYKTWWTLTTHQKEKLLRRKKSVLLSLHMPIEIIRYRLLDKDKLMKVQQYEALRKKYLPKRTRMRFWFKDDDIMFAWLAYLGWWADEGTPLTKVGAQIERREDLHRIDKYKSTYMFFSLHPDHLEQLNKKYALINKKRKYPKYYYKDITPHVAALFRGTTKKQMKKLEQTYRPDKLYSRLDQALLSKLGIRHSRLYRGRSAIPSEDVRNDETFNFAKIKDLSLRNISSIR